MATCRQCKVKMPWGVNDPIAVGNKVRNVTGQFLTAMGGADIAVGAIPDTVSYYCGECWARRMDPGGLNYGIAGVELTGAAPPAQTLADDLGGLQNEGISFACTHKFFNENHEVQWPRIVFIFAHEMMHWLSHNHAGFQAVGKAPFNWDEAMTDYITSNIFPKIASAGAGAPDENQGRFNAARAACSSSCTRTIFHRS